MTAANQHQVPASVLVAVCTHESQTYHQGLAQPWPWTLNIDGKGIWYASRLDALNALFVTRQLGINNVDIGLCQVNWRWHGRYFSSKAELLDPANNVNYAAQYLRSLKREGEETWDQAIGRYHSPSNPSRSAHYLSQVQRHLRAVN